MSDGRQVTTNYENLGSKLKATTSYDAESENSIEQQRAGWQAILDIFNKYDEFN